MPNCRLCRLCSYQASYGTICGSCREKALVRDLELLKPDELKFYEQTCLRKENYSPDPTHRSAFDTVAQKYGMFKRMYSKGGPIPILQPAPQEEWEKNMSQTSYCSTSIEHHVLIKMARERDYYKQQFDKYKSEQQMTKQQLETILRQREQLEYLKREFDSQVTVLKTNHQDEIANLQKQIESMKNQLIEKDKMILGLL